MEYESVLPFQFVDNADLVVLLNSNSSSDAIVNLISLDELNKKNFRPIVCDERGFQDNVDPDRFLRDSLGLQLPECNYYFPEPCDFNINPNEAFLSLLHLNIGSIPKSLEGFFEQCISPFEVNIDIFGFTETKLTNDIEHLYDIPMYNRYCNNNSRRSGGVALYIKDVFKCRELPHLRYTEETIETIFVEVDYDTVVGVVYRRPNTDEREFLDKFSNILMQLETRSKSCYIMGDFNIDLFKSNNNTVKSLLANCHSKLFFNTITKPTRVFGASATLIDHMWTNNASQNILNGILFTNISDHFPTFSFYRWKNNNVKGKPSTVVKRNFCEDNIVQFMECLRQVCWTLVYASQDANVCYRNFILIFLNCFNKCFPLEEKTYIKSHHKPYITPEIRTLITQKNKLQRKYAKKPITYGEQYRQLRNKITQKIREAKGNYYKRQLQQCEGNVKKIWTIINSILSRKESSPSNEKSFKVNNSLISGPSEIANQFNKYFVEIGSKLASQIHSEQIDFRQYLLNRYDDEFKFPVVTRDQLLHVVKSMKDSASGHDEIPIRIIKIIIEDIADVLLYLCNLSFTAGTFPDLLEIAKVLPFFKSGDHSLFNNYRPISILPVISKIIEKLAFESLYKYCIEKQIITESQFGFMRGKSTEDAILSFTENILSAFDKKQFTIGVFLDFSKAFDTVNHNILLSKLDYYGIRHRAKDWFYSYLSKRQQYVSYNGHKSGLSSTSCGVPQGSILGPLLFLIYINDIIHSSQYLKFVLFADDSNLYLSNDNLNDLTTMLNQELELVRKWIISNKLTLNLNKTHYIIFHRKKIPLHIPSIMLGNSVLERVQFTQFLGVTIQENLRWDKHIQKVSDKVNKLCGILYLTRHQFTTSALNQIYYSLIYPNLTYCITVWGASEKSKISQIILAQKRVIRTVRNLQRRDHTNESFASLKVLKFVDVVNYFHAVYVFKSLNGIKENNYFHRRTNAAYNLRNGDTLQTPVASSTQTQRFIAYHGAKIWNSLPLNIRNKNTLSSFKTSLKSFYITSYNSNSGDT